MQELQKYFPDDICNIIDEYVSSSEHYDKFKDSLYCIQMRKLSQDIWDYPLLKNPNNIIKQLYKCNCCKRHQEKKPDDIHCFNINYYLHFWNDYIYNEHHYLCSCSCRQTIRYIIRKYNKQTIMYQKYIDNVKYLKDYENQIYEIIDNIKYKHGDIDETGYLYKYNMIHFNVDTFANEMVRVITIYKDMIHDFFEICQQATLKYSTIHNIKKHISERIIHFIHSKLHFIPTKINVFDVIERFIYSELSYLNKQNHINIIDVKQTLKQSMKLVNKIDLLFQIESSYQK